MAEYIEKRRFERVGHIAPVTIGRAEEPEPKCEGKLLNYSLGGMFIESDYTLNQGEKVSISIQSRAPESSDVVVRAYQGQVKWKKMIQDPYSAMYCYGLEISSPVVHARTWAP